VVIKLNTLGIEVSQQIIGAQISVPALTTLGACGAWRRAGLIQLRSSTRSLARCSTEDSSMQHHWGVPPVTVGALRLSMLLGGR